MNYIVYIHRNKINDKKYIGITKRTTIERWGSNGQRYKRSNPYFYNAIEKYGWENFEHIIYAEGLSKNDACNIEIKLIKEYKTQEKEFGYNIESGGTSAHMSDETKQKISKALKGNKNGQGIKCSEEKKKKISEAQKGRKLTEEHKLKLSLAKKGKSHKSPSIETRNKISKSHKKCPVFCEETNTIYESIQDCARKLNIPATCVCRCCKNKSKSVYGYHLSYYINVIKKPND
jgi:group I intron endonuclease